MGTFLKNIATLGFIGYLPVAPGTFGSLVGLLFFLLMEPSTLMIILILLFLFPLGTAASHSAEILLDKKDSGHIVIDEFCGYLFSMLFLPASIGYAVSAFFLFRFFDILKPFPVNIAESSLSGGIGIMADDLVAALYTNIILHVWHAFA
jgi:phosphatidylglycerophosphatase A